jgi:hypothetical protein
MNNLKLSVNVYGRFFPKEEDKEGEEIKDIPHTKSVDLSGESDLFESYLKPQLLNAHKPSEG